MREKRQTASFDRKSIFKILRSNRDDRFSRLRTTPTVVNEIWIIISRHLLNTNPRFLRFVEVVTILTRVCTRCIHRIRLTPIRTVLQGKRRIWLKEKRYVISFESRDFSSPIFFFFSNTHNTNFHIFKKRINEQLLRYKFTTYFLRMDEIFHGESRCKDFFTQPVEIVPWKRTILQKVSREFLFSRRNRQFFFFFFFSSCDRMLIDSICSSFCGNDCDFRSGPESAVVVIGMNGQIFSFPSFFLSSVMALPRSNDSK